MNFFIYITDAVEVLTSIERNDSNYEMFGGVFIMFLLLTDSLTKLCRNMNVSFKWAYNQPIARDFYGSIIIVLGIRDKKNT